MNPASEELKSLAEQLDRILTKDNDLVIDVDFLELIRAFAKFCNRVTCHPGFMVRNEDECVFPRGEER